MKEALELVEAFASIATVILAFLAWRQIRLLREQATTAFEDSLTEHYRSIMTSIPTDVWLGAELNTLAKERHDDCRDAIYRYIDLCNEQAVLNNMERVRDETWIEWCKGIRGNMDLPAFNEVWAEVREKCPGNFAELRALVGH
jgi:hypothetical protein